MPRRRALSMLLSCALLGACGTDELTRIAIKVTLRPVSVITSTTGSPAPERMVFTTDSRWDLFGARLQGCPDQDDPDVEAPPPWTAGIVSRAQLACEPSADATACGTRDNDRTCCNRVRLPNEAWCTVDTLPDVWDAAVEGQPPPGALVIKGTIPSTGASLDAWLEVPALGVTTSTDTPFVLNEERTTTVAGTRRTVVRPRGLLMELGDDGWLEAVSSALKPEGTLLVRPGDGLHDALVDRLVAGAALYLEERQDGLLDDDERATGPLGTFTSLRP